MSRITPMARKCLDLFWQYSRNEITKAEMDSRLDEIEGKQPSLPYEEEKR